MTARERMRLLDHESAQRKAVRLWGYRGATIAPPVGALFTRYEVGRLYYVRGGARFVAQGVGASWRAAFANAVKP